MLNQSLNTMYNIENMANLVKAYSEKLAEYNAAQQNIQAEAKRFYGIVKDFMHMVDCTKLVCGPLTITRSEITWKDNVLNRETLNNAYDAFDVIVNNHIHLLDSIIKPLNTAD